MQSHKIRRKKEVYNMESEELYLHKGLASQRALQHVLIYKIGGSITSPALSKKLL